LGGPSFWGRGSMPLKWQTRNPFSWCQRQHTNSKLQQQLKLDEKKTNLRVGGTLGAINYAARGRCCNLMPFWLPFAPTPAYTAFNLNRSASPDPQKPTPFPYSQLNCRGGSSNPSLSMEFGNQPAELAAQSSIRVLAGKNGNKSWPKLLQPNGKRSWQLGPNTIEFASWFRPQIWNFKRSILNEWIIDGVF